MPEDSTLPPELRTQLARFFARTWSDEVLRQDFERDPRAALATVGIDWPSDLPLPELPERPENAIDLESLEASAGSAVSTIGTVSCPTGCFSRQNS
ncbi:hypothetical protein [Herbidospora mongoliensis]|uniref:hypothetical protein n=1 Tax=Herbidospora mongoliensis TaxID=688067 RepID=UPI00082953C4|nr:hypothetical protein [Herbidospora mongoliensis]